MVSRLASKGLGIGIRPRLKRSGTILQRNRVDEQIKEAWKLIKQLRRQREHRGDAVEREGRQLFDAHQQHIIHLARRPCVDIWQNLAAAQDDLAHLVWRHQFVLASLSLSLSLSLAFLLLFLFLCLTVFLFLSLSIQSVFLLIYKIQTVSRLPSVGDHFHQ